MSPQLLKENPRGNRKFSPRRTRMCNNKRKLAYEWPGRTLTFLVLKSILDGGIGIHTRMLTFLYQLFFFFKLKVKVKGIEIN